MPLNDILTSSDREELEKRIARILRENGCPEEKVSDIAFELTEKFVVDPEISTWLLEKLNRKEAN